jgi:2-oxoglutarate ferredoxin oxidoreductase subunit delta
MSQKPQVIINESWCKGCEICVDICPRKVLIMEDFVARVADIDQCTGCMMCELLCPDFAIVVHPAEKKKKSVTE